MKKLAIILFSAFVFSAGGCIKNDDITFTETVIEMDAAAYNANFTGRTYPMLTRVPGQGRATSANFSDPLLTRSSGNFQLRVNLVGPQRSSDVVVTYAVDAAATTAVPGTHYAALGGTVTIPANSSFGYIPVSIINAAPAPGTTVDLVVTLRSADGGARISENYKSVGLRIAQ
jgi:hypothetical protein